MTLFLPFGNETFPCLGVDEFNAPRPQLGSELTGALIALCVVVCATCVGATFLAYRFRKEPMFYRIRPLPFIAFLNFACAVASCGYLIPMATLTFPCALELVIHCACASLVTSVVGIRGLIFLVESQYSILLANEVRVVDQDDSVSVVSNAAEDKEEKGLWFAFWQCARLGYLMKPLSKFTVNDLVQIRRHYFGIFLLIFIPPFPMLLIAAMIMPPYSSGCVSCPINLQFILVVFIGPIFQDFALAVYVFLALRRVKLDEQLVGTELFICAMGSMLWIVMGYGLEIADPGQLQYNRVFSWRILLVFGPLFYVISSVFFPAYMAMRYKNFRARNTRQNSSQSIDTRRDFLSHLNTQPELKKDFFQFAASRYCMESLNFVEDISAYKAECLGGRSDKWKKSKAKRLINTYMQVGAPQEVNISSLQRSAVTDIDLETLSGERLTNVFSEAYDEVIGMLASGTWIDFQNEKKKKAKKDQTSKMVVAAAAAPETGHRQYE